MSTLEWSKVGERFYEAGADHGVLYIDGLPGVPWNGLTSVEEKSSGGSPKPYYYDAFKYLNISSFEEFEATIEAFTAPQEFSVCDGTSEIANGLFITQQPRKSFGFSYRTGLGNDTVGLSLGYKLHLVYNALAAPSTRSNKTLSESPEAVSLSWEISTMAPFIPGYRPSAHLVVDSTRTPEEILSELEGILYGNELNDPRLPTQNEMIALFTT